MRRDDAGGCCSAAAAGRYLKRSVRSGSDRMNHHAQFYIGGRWVDPVAPASLDVVDPSTEQSFTAISLGSNADVDRAVRAARAAFDGFSRWTREDRLGLLRRILDGYNSRAEDPAEAISREMGAALSFARKRRSGRAGCISKRRSRRLRPTNSADCAERLHRQGAGRGRRARHPLELAAEPASAKWRRRWRPAAPSC